LDDGTSRVFDGSPIKNMITEDKLELIDDEGMLLIPNDNIKNSTIHDLTPLSLRIKRESIVEKTHGWVKI
jgi:hypothetical protein